MKKVVFTFGRMNPVTVGHEKLVNKVQSVAKTEKADARIYLSHTQNKKKDPLDYPSKIKYATKAFGSIVTKTNAKTIIQVLQELQSAGYTDVTLVVGSDRIPEFKKLLTKYNGKDYTFNSINFVSAGERDPDADDVSGMSASKMRALAKEGDFASFKAGLPNKLKASAKEIFDKLRSIMEEEQIEESSLNLQQRQKRSRLMKRLSKKIQRKKEIAKKRMANSEKLQKRAMKKARALIRKKVAGKKGENYASLSSAEKIAIDKMVDRKQSMIAKIAKKLLPKVRKAEMERLKQARSTHKESVELNEVDPRNEPNLARAVDNIAQEKQRDKKKFDRMRDSARIRDTVYRNRREENLRGKAEEAGVTFEEILAVFESAEINPNKLLTDDQQRFHAVNHFVAEAKKMKDDPCWKDYEMVGMKKKNGKEVPNCVPKNEATSISPLQKARMDKEKADRNKDKAKDTQASRIKKKTYAGMMGRLKESLEETIKHEDGKYVIYSKDGSKKLGEYDTETEAKKRLGQIEYFKHAKEETQIDERSPWGDVKVAFNKKFNKNYEKALDWMKKTGRSAADAERMFRGTDARELARMAEEYGCEGEAKPNSAKNHKKKMLKDVLPKSGAGQIGTDELVKSYLAQTPGMTIEGYCPETDELKEELVVEEAEYQGKKVTLNNPFRLPSGSKKKFGVYVKNDKGNVVKVQFGDPNMEIKRDDPERRKAFRSRHSCDDDRGPKWKARYWSCYQWRAGAKVDN
jgi:nicotinic acid mononucleotide adenylyltransferase